MEALASQPIVWIPFKSFGKDGVVGSIPIGSTIVQKPPLRAVFLFNFVAQGLNLRGSRFITTSHALTRGARARRAH
jgi:hypothetical protein